MTEENKSPIAKREEEILKFWQENKIFEKSVEKDAPRGDFVFYDGPPFATGEPHFGHVLPTTIKDLIPRYKTMQGYRVERKWGWDCHGLPIENLIEKELGFNSKREIEEYGIDKFNKAARASVLRYADVWKKVIPRLGRWADMKNDYRTMDSTYTESVWWSFKKLFQKGRIYESFKSMQICPRCGTTLSNFEVNQGYKDVTDISVYAKFQMIDEPNTYVLAWTTTPWTLPGNVALAINPKIQYVQVESEGVSYIMAKERLPFVFKEKKYDIEREMKFEELIGKSYKPLFPYYQNANLRSIDGKPVEKNRGWKIYAADFVTTEEGTGIVHIAPAFGEEDFELAKKENLPFVQHIKMDGTFKEEVTDFAGQLAKPKEDPQKTDVEIIKYLAARNLLFAKEKIIHSYPHCWRCDTPLLNYATSSWFVKVTDFKDKLVRENKKIKWVPESIGSNRFGDWLAGARDWAISRSRYWGAPIPVWKCSQCQKMEVLGSVENIKEKTKKNNYYVMRHGEGEHNLTNTLSSVVNTIHPYHLTDKGKEVVKKNAQKLKAMNIDVIIHSPLTRTKETAELVKEALDNKNIEIISESRISEEHFGKLEGRPYSEYKQFFEGRFDLSKRLPNGESLRDVHHRVGEFLFEIDKKFQNKNILIVTHDGQAKMINVVAKGESDKSISKEWQNLMKRWDKSGSFLTPGEFTDLSFSFLPHNENYELDFHRPYIDQVSWQCDCGGEFKRVPEVFDVWYESGSMPYGKIHYPFDSHSLAQGKSWKIFSKAKPAEFPADFIAEGLDQTRGWFYSLLVLNYELFGRSPYKNVVVNGLILAEDGRKMSKRLKNYPELTDTLNKFSADALRYFLVASPAVRAEEMRFSEKGLDEVTKKILNRLLNVVSFYELYKSGGQESGVRDQGSKNVLDQWIVARLNQLNLEITTHLDKYELDKAARPIADFVDDLSTWYLRRSRERFKSEDTGDKENALFTLNFVLRELSKLIAPFMPFLAEDIYQRVKPLDYVQGRESVHLEKWPAPSKVEGPDLLLEKMQEVRKVVSLGLEARAKANIKVRQPLKELKIKNKDLGGEFLQLIKDEVNVKWVLIDKHLDTEVELNTELTPELKEEGQVRELLRAVQDLRKEAGLQVGEKAALVVSTSAAGKALIEKFRSEISKAAGLSEIKFEENDGVEIKIADLVFKLKLTPNS